MSDGTRTGGGTPSGVGDSVDPDGETEEAASEGGDDASTDALRRAARATTERLDEGPPAPWVPAVGTLIAGKYRLTRRLDEGSYGTVFEATHDVTGKRVGIKWLKGASDRRSYQRFLQEAKAAGSIEHPNVIDIYDIGNHQGGDFLVMELLVGTSVRALMGRPMSIQQMLDIILPTLRGLANAHQAKVIHRDLKPENLFVHQPTPGSPPVIKVLDFGVAKRLEETHADRTQTARPLTTPGSVIGTPEYMSPEQLHAQPIDERTDIYALGVIMYEALTGRRPFGGPTVFAVATAIQNHQVRPLHELAPNVTDTLEAVVMRAMAKNPEERYPSCDALIAALLSATTEAPSQGTSPPSKEASTSSSAGTAERRVTVQHEPASPRRWRVVAAGLSLAAVAGIAVGYRSLQFLESQRESAPTKLIRNVPPVSSAAAAPTPDTAPVVTDDLLPASLHAPVPHASAFRTPHPSPLGRPAVRRTAPRTEPGRDGSNVQAPTDPQAAEGQSDAGAPRARPHRALKHELPPSASDFL